MPGPDQPGLVEALEALRRLDVKLGVIMGADEDGAEPDPRSVRDLAWHACQISRADTRHLYSFMFLDLTRALSARALKTVVRRIRAGRTASGKPCPGVPAANRGWPKLIVNDNHTATLRSKPWAHAKRLELLGDKVSARRVRRAANGRASALLPGDRRFLRRVARLGDGSFAILRFEVTSQTHRFAGLPVAQQCPLLRQWASLQHSAGYALIYPLYVHGIPNQTTFYDSFMQGTFGLELALIDRYPADAVGNAGGCEVGGPQPGASPGGTPPPAAPAAVAPAVRSLEPSALTCNSARLHGSVNPHGTATSFQFVYWKRGTDDRQQTTGIGSAGAGSDWVDVSRIADGLRPDTGYSARVVATNAVGRSVSDVVSFSTKARC